MAEARVTLTANMSAYIEGMNAARDKTDDKP